MKLTDRPIPRTDAFFQEVLQDEDVPTYDLLRSLEQQLACAVETLEFYSGKGFSKAKQALAEIAAAQEGRVG